MGAVQYAIAKTLFQSENKMEKSYRDVVVELSLLKTQVVTDLLSTCTDTIRGTEWTITCTDKDTFSRLQESESKLIGCVSRKDLISTISVFYPKEDLIYRFESSYAPIPGDRLLAEFSSSLSSDVSRKSIRNRSRPPSF